MNRTATMIACTACLALPAAALAQDQPPRGGLEVAGITYRAAHCEREKVHEAVDERPNVGGLLYVYVRNAGTTTQSIRDWRWGREEGSGFRISGKVVWDRFSHRELAPGEMAAVEICGVTEEFGPGASCRFSLVTGDWGRGATRQGTLTEDPVRVTYLRFLPGLREVEVHLHNEGDSPVGLGELTVPGHAIEATERTADSLPARGAAILRARLAEPLSPGETVIASVGVERGEGDPAVYSHRRAFEDAFAIGTWGIPEHLRTAIRQHHIDTCFMGPESVDSFYRDVASRYGFRAMSYTTITPRVEFITAVRDSPAVLCWTPQDEPDWHYSPQVVYAATEMIRQYGPTRPIEITLCRNVRFFEYAGLADIPCMDHYSVTAPSTSVWPKPWGTRLEETAIYTRDLRLASEPKPVWVWSQGIADWSERPKRPVPTPEELAAQLVLNLGAGAKGILWFTFGDDKGERYPELRDAMREWGRVLVLARPGLLGAEPAAYETVAPPKLDVAPLVGWDRMFLALTNLDYEIDDEAYPWNPIPDAVVRVRCPEWIRPACAVALDPDGVHELPLTAMDRMAEVRLGELRVARMVALLNDAGELERYRQEFDRAVADESRDY